ncbi:GntR family transcriptional regulator [Azospirillum canadense]|uniref:GntR family transcriptional regulator n=1 Tax=Azospirillum canadense TaxID=403962 RepID=UPI002227C9CE|nr:GntR family transcriptional regulator [Azospirillum canadense]MCW2241013.1 DNA-binding GntR family transcriptional regulator [Azospirillum canadense]
MPATPPTSPVSAFDRPGPRQHGVYDALRAAVLSGDMRPGEGISETRVAARFGVSRTPVREAFRRLADEGLLRIVPQVGTFVAPIQLSAVADSQFIRETLECRTVRLAAERAGEADVAALAGLMDRQRAAMASARHDDFFALDEALHAELIRIAGRPAVWDLLVTVKAQLDRVRVLSLHSEGWATMILTQHERIVDRVAARDVAGAEDAMREHLRTVFAAVDDIAQANSHFFEK